MNTVKLRAANPCRRRISVKNLSRVQPDYFFERFVIKLIRFRESFAVHRLVIQIPHHSFKFARSLHNTFQFRERGISA